MKPALLGGFFLMALAGGAAGSWLTTASSPPDGDKAKRSAGTKPEKDLAADDDDDDKTPADPAQDEARIRDLEHRVSLLTAALSKGGGNTEDARRALDASNGGTEFSDVADPVFEAAVLDIFDRQQERKEEEQKEFRTTLRVKQGKQFAAHLGDSLNLNPGQREEIAQAVTRYFETISQLRNDESTDRPVTRKEWREHMDEVNKSADASLAQILDPAQFKAYEALDDDEKLGFGRRPREARDSKGNQ
jgi:predicted O-linked N-acetylglucosamine transferase (SPINDLY family)